ncbi:DNA polymerase family A-domain-containing protein [Zychaea mexicana]|uniref:DNA polymerase family A-domain-containing protein n=1 Tax=Zychaea mexicana TaxID=64656 RepID=UPI0022FE130A|nr:DNA polymerase family A-domain-containing protein [Zychaea mexicana]KAI9492160.1 DNA polymerase family A-domain-containing protein [Zychaea mexicana]
MSTRITCDTKVLRRITLTTRSIDARLLHTSRVISAKAALSKKNNPDVRINAANVQLLSPKLHAQVFGRSSPSGARDLKARKAAAKEHLELQGIWGKASDVQEPIALKLPEIYGRDIEEHFMRIGFEQSGSYLEKAEQFADISLPSMPNTWSQQPGWTRYDKGSGKAASVDHPEEEMLVFDVEVLVNTGQYPVMAVAASGEAWYSWTSPYLSGDSDNPNHLIPLGSGKERIVVGHNVGYDRARIANEYSRAQSDIRYLDTMSLHIAVSGLCSQQRPAWTKRKNQQDKAAMGATTAGAVGAVDGEISQPDFQEAKFFDVSSLNSLKDVAKFHCDIELDKSVRSYFETGTLQDIQENFQEAMRYCALDVDMTHRIYKVVLPKFRANCPHPVSFAGMLNMGNSFLTVTEKWEHYLERSSRKHDELSDMVDVKLSDLAEKARVLVDQPEVWQNDPWLCQLDWHVNPRQRKLKGQPKWYKDAYDSKTEKLKISIRSRIAPVLLRLKWNGHPLHYIPKQGWCYKVLLSQVDENTPKPILQDDTYSYIKVPHKDGADANCGNPLAKGYIGAYEDRTMTSEYEAAKQALELNAKSAYWISARERILGQFVVWDNNTDVDMKLPKRQQNDGKYGMILPQMVTMGTVTRRAVEKTWLTASNAKANRIGSELKSMVEVPEGYKIVGADVDSEELWISSVIGDAQFGFHGASALGWMTLQGSKSEGTDLHSKTASILGISRDKAKIFNYARIYGAGVKYATSLLLQYSQGMDPETAKERALALYASTKGEKEHSTKNRFDRQFWHGGSESYMFNALEDIALSKEPRTPVLGCAITDALKPRYTGTQFLTSRVNWVVQSSGVDYLHLLITSMAHLIDRYQINARFMLSVHDEVRYLSTEEDKHRTALALQVANLWTRALFSWKMGVESLPQSVAFFSAVDIDHVLRKEPSMPCTTPSHEEKIKEGVTCTVDDTLCELEAVTQQSRNNVCLLGDARETTGRKIDDKVIKRNLQKLQKPREPCSLDFLKAQMHENYRATLSPASPQGRETEEIVTQSLPTAPLSLPAFEFHQVSRVRTVVHTGRRRASPSSQSSSSFVKTVHPIF